MPNHSAAQLAESAPLIAAPRSPSSWRRPVTHDRGASTSVDRGAVASALLSWAEQDDGCLVFLHGRPTGEPQVSWVNRGGAQLLGYEPEELVGESLSRLLRSPFAAAHMEQDQSQPLVDPRRVVRRSLRVQRRDGSPLRVAFASVPTGTGPAPSWLVRLTHEPDVDRVTQDLRSSNERFRALADRAPIAIFSSESGLRLGYVNDRFSEVYGEAAELLVGTGWLDFVHPDDREAVVEAMAAVLRGNGQELPLRVLRQDGSERSVLARIVPVPSSRRDSGFVGTLEDVTERQAWEQTLAYQASHDPLTGLFNRRRMLELLRDELAAQCSGSRGRPALLFLDLDDFKLLNDSMGHEAGDHLLLEVARRMEGAVREGDVVSRFGGDEFAVLCRNVADERAAAELARRLLQAVTGTIPLGSTTVPVSGSVGVVLAQTDRTEAEDMLRDADVAMYQAKAAGKDCWALFDEGARRQAQQRLDLARDLRAAVEQGHLTVEYQPIVRLGPRSDDSPRLASVEALVRWSHPARGMVSPEEFIELAEKNGLITQLGLQVLRTACRQMVRWQERLGAGAPPSVSVNVSAVQLREPDFPDVVRTILRETGLPGSALCLELTETVVMQDPTAAAASFRRLHELGVRVSIDDFGTGHSSLSLLRQLPFDQLKIDRSLLADLGSRNDDPVVAAVVALGRAMDMVVVAEGVETQDQVAELHGLGCPLAQGYYFGEALPPQAVEAWVLRDTGVPPAGAG
jgi:diguanylate cyclase (GGDEF)-like protein/PAS domain S-box-containing protein